MRRVAVIAFLVVLAACKPDDDPPPDPTAAAAAQKPQPTVLDDITKVPMDKARAVEQDVLDNAKKTDEVLDEAEGGG